MCRTALAAVLLAAGAATAAPDPLRLVPKDAGLVFAAGSPRRLVEGVARLDAYRNLRQFPQVREVFESTPVRRFFQIVGYLERELGAPWPELLDKLAGGGVALGVAVGGPDPAPAVLVVQGTDAAAVEKAYALFLAVVEEQAGRDGSPAVRKGSYRGVPTYHLGTDAHYARVGAAAVVANTEAGLHAALRLAEPGAAVGDSVLGKPTLAAARALAGDGLAGWGWLDLAKAKDNQQARDFFETTRKDIFQTLLFGGTVDAVRRSDFVAFGLRQADDGYALTVRLPARRADLDDVMRLHVPPAGTPGTLPLLRPKGVVYSQSFYLDLGHLWRNRKAVVNAQNLKDIEKGVADIDRVLPGTTFGELLERSGPYHRFVAAHTGETPYATQPGQVIPPTALVFSMRDPAYGESMDGILKAAALLAGFQTGWAMREETHDGVRITTYRFPEKGTPKFDDPGRLRFNFAPSFAVVGTSLVVGSTPGIVKALVPELRAEAAAKPAPTPVVWQARGFAPGVADLMLASPEATVTATVLTQGVGLDEATRQVRAFAGWLRTVGTVGAALAHDERFFEFELDWRIHHRGTENTEKK
jgi:hypothetical protein